MGKVYRIKRTTSFISLITATLLIVLHGCGAGSNNPIVEDGETIVRSSGSESQSVNGPLTGDIWYRGGRNETHRFNLVSGTSSVINGEVIPSRNGTFFTSIEPNWKTISAISSHCGEGIDIARVTIFDTRAMQPVSQFTQQEPIRFPVKPSPDGTRVMAISNVHPCDQDGFRDPPNVTIYSSEGEMLFRFVDSVIAYDWLGDGRAAALRSMGNGIFQVLVETAPGSNDFEFLVNWTFPEGTTGIRVHGLKANTDGTKFLLELVQDESRVVSIHYRYSDILMLDTIAGRIYSLFTGNEPDGSIRASEPVFSPDGNWVVASQDFWAGGVVLETTAISLPASGVTYAVPSTAEGQLLPPEELSENIRAIFRQFTANTVAATRLNPVDGLHWTPTIR